MDWFRFTALELGTDYGKSIHKDSWPQTRVIENTRNSLCEYGAEALRSGLHAVA